MTYSTKTKKISTTISFLIVYSEDHGYPDHPYDR